MNFRNSIPIVIASDNHYAVLVAALIKSIEVNHKTDELLAFTIIDDGISKVNQKKIQQSIDPETTTLSWKKSADVIPADVKIPVDKTSYPLTTYLRLFAPHLIDKNYKKIIYLDVDMIVYDDISNLYNIDIGNCVVGAVTDYIGTFGSERGIPNYKELGFTAETKYFNAGLLLINSEKWREENIADKVIKCMNDNKKSVLHADQYGLNIILHNKWFELDRVWNCSDLFTDPANPSLIHFLATKPVFKSCFSLQKHKDEFYRLLSLTAYKDFKPISDYYRKIKKSYTKVKKAVSNIVASVS